MAETITDIVKRKLDITWSDEATDARIADIIAAAEPTMRHKLGLPESYDFAAVGQERSLFLSYCLYEWNQAANEFDANYLNDILQVRQRWAVRSAEGVGFNADEANGVQ